MRKLLYILVIVALSACSTSINADKGDGSAAIDTAVLVQRVTDIYEVALWQYNDMDAHGSAEIWIYVDSLFCTADWNSWVRRVTDFDMKENSGTVGFFEADYWIMGQDWNELSISDMKVTAMTDSTATVELNLHNCGSVTPVRLEMKHEEGEWKIDNFIDLGHDFDWKARMKEYLNNSY